MRNATQFFLKSFCFHLFFLNSLPKIRIRENKNNTGEITSHAEYIPNLFPSISDSPCILKINVITSRKAQITNVAFTKKYVVAK